METFGGHGEIATEKKKSLHKSPPTLFEIGFENDYGAKKFPTK